jgi:hypothetical protein
MDESSAAPPPAVFKLKVILKQSSAAQNSATLDSGATP